MAGDTVHSTILQPEGARGLQSSAAVGRANPTLHTGTVRAFLSETVSSIALADGTGLHATQATSCLLAPAIGDHVLLYREGDEAYVLAVLAREHAYDAAIAVPNARTLSFRAQGEIAFSAPLLRLAAGKVALMCEQFLQMGSMLTSSFRRTVESTDEKSVTVRTLSTSVENRSTIVTGTDMLHARSLIETVDGVATQTSEIALITARRDVRLDGERVSLG
jgi:hypothetical protein